MLSRLPSTSRELRPSLLEMPLLMHLLSRYMPTGRHLKGSYPRVSAPCVEHSNKRRRRHWDPCRSKSNKLNYRTCWPSNGTEQRREQNGRKRGGSGERNKKTVGLVEKSGKKSEDSEKKQKIEFFSED